MRTLWKNAIKRCGRPRLSEPRCFRDEKGGRLFKRASAVSLSEKPLLTIEVSESRVSVIRVESFLPSCFSRGSFRCFSSTASSADTSVCHSVEKCERNPKSERIVDVSVSVLIVGGGPVGLTLALLLQRLGVPCLVSEKRDEVDEQPRAHYISNRTMEVFRALGHLDEALQSQVPCLDAWRCFVYCMKLYNIHDHLIGVRDHFAGRRETRLSDGRVSYEEELSPCKMGQLPQHVLEHLLLIAVSERASPICAAGNFQRSQDDLLKKAIERGVKIARVEAQQLSRKFGRAGRPTSEVASLHLLLGSEWTTCEAAETERGQEGAPLLSRLSVQHGRYLVNVKHDFLVGADGVHSAVRALLQTSLVGPPPLQHLVNVTFKSRVLSEMIQTKQLKAPTADWRVPGAEWGIRFLHRGMLYFVLSPKGVGVMVAHDFDEGLFVVHLPFQPTVESPLADPKHLENAASQVENLVGAPLPDLQVLAAKPWQMSGKVARNFVGFKGFIAGRTALVGDAAHCLPPAGGLGLNLGVADCLNLSWRLARLFAAKEGPFFRGKPIADRQESVHPMLRAYERERRLVAKYFCLTAFENWESGLLIPDALGLSWRLATKAADALSTVAEAAQRAGRIAGMDFQKGASALAKSLFQVIESVGLRQVEVSRHFSGWWDARLAAVSELLANPRRNLGLCFYGADLGYAYKDEEGAEGELVKENAASLWPAASPHELIPSRREGCRMPHAWLSAKLEGKSDRWFRLSTIDIPFLSSRPAAFCLLLMNEEFRPLVERAVFERRSSQRGGAGIEGEEAGEQDLGTEDFVFGALWRSGGETSGVCLEENPLSLKAEDLRRLGVCGRDRFEWRVLWSTEEVRGENSTQLVLAALRSIYARSVRSPKLWDSEVRQKCCSLAAAESLGSALVSDLATADEAEKSAIWRTCLFIIRPDSHLLKVIDLQKLICQEGSESKAAASLARLLESTI